MTGLWRKKMEPVMRKIRIRLPNITLDTINENMKILFFT